MKKIISITFKLTFILIVIFSFSLFISCRQEGEEDILDFRKDFVNEYRTQKQTDEHQPAIKDTIRPQDPPIKIGTHWRL
ncbi:MULTISPECIES: hypothetical protein [Chryseobacterium]|uniref:Lipoprotein n=1 Tax=Chryseobacterium camelliae TaxID=1265445 RepID=A0ABU0TDC1_9FLAO|nr:MULTISPECIES: hypothetical protein [Chryseobacterium]MDT3407134.1 hypothetical protein [Pseudacidovorax intermedius]MDQ1095074.1 hypothetical protein [Chryseobacterium camelliae]MDQ1099013.1 hypothetical protein [Chryseobacterium sp. SORGH_AS_1048]MDR6086361.1 hypothetical protein [Chryseobacterium sp. SORGH_AS_0909]MDR6130734.1 hypothetical protein [Chryseobacterium sp. SORGH_AS_1175]